MANKKVFVVFAILAAVALILAGCYTQLRGPVRTERTETPHYDVYEGEEQEEEDAAIVEESQPLVERHYHYYFDVGPRPWWYDPYWYGYAFWPYRSGFYFSIGVWDWDPWWDVYYPYWYYGRWYWASSPYWYPYRYVGWYYYPYRYWAYGDWSYWVPARPGLEPMKRRPFQRRRGLAFRGQPDSEDWVMSKRPASSSGERRIRKASRKVIKGRTATHEAPTARRIKRRTRTDDRIKVTSQAEVRRIKKKKTESNIDRKTRSKTRRVRTVPISKKPTVETERRERGEKSEMKVITHRRIRRSTPVARTPSRSIRSITIHRPATTSRAPAPAASTKSTNSSSKSSNKSSRRRRR